MHLRPFNQAGTADTSTASMDAVCIPSPHSLGETITATMASAAAITARGTSHPRRLSLHLGSTHGLACDGVADMDCISAATDTGCMTAAITASPASVASTQQSASSSYAAVVSPFALVKVELNVRAKAMRARDFLSPARDEQAGGVSAGRRFTWDADSLNPYYDVNGRFSSTQSKRIKLSQPGGTPVSQGGDVPCDDGLRNRALFANLPTDAFMHMLSFLRPAEMCICARVCREWWRLSDDPVLWEALKVKLLGVI